MKRGDIVTVSAQGDYGKPRPAVVIQSDWLRFTDSVLVALLTSTLVDAPVYRLNLEPDKSNGRKISSQIMVDKILALPRDKCGKVLGKLDQASLATLNHMLSVVIGLAD
jgi:mRNA interferase MazF